MCSRFLIAFFPVLLLASCGGREFSASIAIPVSGPGRKAAQRSHRLAPKPLFPPDASPFRVPTVTEELPADADSSPTLPAGGSTPADDGPSSVTIRPPATP